MTINIQSLHFDADKKLLAFAEEKVKKLNQFYENIVDVNVTLRIDKSAINTNKIAEIKLNVKGSELFAKKQCVSFEEAIDVACEALSRQLKKYKEKMFAQV